MKKTNLLAGAFLILAASVSFAGVDAGFGLQWITYSFTPLAEEDTPNYYSIGPHVSFGYSVGSWVDLNLYGRFNPARQNSASPGQGTVQFYDYGLELGGRIVKAIYIGARGGTVGYRLLKQTTEDEIPGKWLGSGGMLVIGGLIKPTKKSFIQIGLDVGGAKLSRTDVIDSTSRMVNWIGLSVIYTYIGFDSFRVENVVLGDWLK